MAVLLDVNVLIALVDEDHVGYDTVQEWFLRRQSDGWATCAITENGMIRVLSQPAYASGQRRPSEVLDVLAELKSKFRSSHEFWADDISLTDDSVFDTFLIAGARQITDVYLLGLASHHKGTFASFDRSLTWRAVRGASADLVEQLPSNSEPRLH
jgi:toxin-antitoxin system PIN domain toxin